MFTFLTLFFSLSLLTFTSCREDKSTKDKIEEVGDDIEEGVEEVGDEIDDHTDDKK
tara:strand:- start:11996 stop:12163 length:168 start_codon:yes stop_codon:yes gene_type:complete